MALTVGSFVLVLAAIDAGIAREAMRQGYTLLTLAGTAVVAAIALMAWAVRIDERRERSQDRPCHALRRRPPAR